MRRVPRAPLAGVLLLACDASASRDAGPAHFSHDAPGRAAITVALVDSVPFRNELESGTLRRVLVTTPAGADTIREVLTAQLPVAVDDALVVGFRYDGALVRGVFHYVPRTGYLGSTALPSDFVAFGTPRLAPDGRHVLYFGQDSTGGGYGVVLAWPSGAVRWRGAPVHVLAADGGIDDATWHSARSFTQAILLAAPPRAFQRTRGTIGPDGAVRVQVDTVVPAPEHDGAR